MPTSPLQPIWPRSTNAFSLIVFFTRWLRRNRAHPVIQHRCITTHLQKSHRLEVPRIYLQTQSSLFPMAISSVCPPAIELISNSSASDTPTKNNKLLQARPKQPTAVRALNLRRVLRLLSRYSPTITTQLPLHLYPIFPSLHSVSLLQREQPAAITSKSDFPPPRHPHENNKSLPLQISAASPPIYNPLAAAPAVLCPSVSKANIPIYTINTASPPLFPNEWMKKLSYQIPGKNLGEPPRVTSQLKARNKKGRPRRIYDIIIISYLLRVTSIYFFNNYRKTCGECQCCGEKQKRIGRAHV